MKTIVHLSDLHFGRVNDAIVQPLLDAVHALRPTVVAVSGDLTQRAKRREFKAAATFLAALPRPQVVVPGNHDIPLYNLLNRFARPLNRYRRYITEDLLPFYHDEEIAICGVNTARSMTIKDGRISATQVRWIRAQFASVGSDVTKIVVTHHPFDIPAGHDHGDLVDRAEMAIKELAESGVDLFLAGHLHLTHTGHTAARYKACGQSALVVQAGTAISTRGRGQLNSFNVIRIERSKIVLEGMEWNAESATFAVGATEEFVLRSEGWAPA